MEPLHDRERRKGQLLLHHRARPARFLIPCLSNIASYTRTRMPGWSMPRWVVNATPDRLGTKHRSSGYPTTLLYMFRAFAHLFTYHSSSGGRGGAATGDAGDAFGDGATRRRERVWVREDVRVQQSKIANTRLSVVEGSFHTHTLPTSGVLCLHTLLTLNTP